MKTLTYQAFSLAALSTGAYATPKPTSKPSSAPSSNPSISSAPSLSNCYPGENDPDGLWACQGTTTPDIGNGSCKGCAACKDSVGE